MENLKYEVEWYVPYLPVQIKSMSLIFTIVYIVAISITKRYLTSLLMIRSYASLT